MIRNVSLLTKRKKSDSPGKLTKALSPIDAPGSHPGMGDRSVNASSFFPSASNSCANLAALASPIQVGQAGLTRGVVSLPGMDVHMIQPRSGDELEEGGNKVWCEALINGELSALAAQLKNEIGWDIDREIDDVGNLADMTAARPRS